MNYKEVFDDICTNMVPIVEDVNCRSFYYPILTNDLSHKAAAGFYCENNGVNAVMLEYATSFDGIVIRQPAYPRAGCFVYCTSIADYNLIRLVHPELINDFVIIKHGWQP